MPTELSFDIVHHFDQGLPGITVPVTLELGASEAHCETKLDTGCTHCVFRRAIGETLGLDIESGQHQEFGSVSGNLVKAYGHWVTLSVLGMQFDSMVYFAADPYFKRNLLGRHGFLDRVILGLIDHDGTLFLNRL